MRYDITVTSELDGAKLGDILRGCGFSGRLISSLKRVENGICINGVRARTCDICREGDVITLTRADKKTPDPNPGLSVPILYENDRVVVFDKPRGMPVHESEGHRGDSLANAFAAHCSGLAFRCINRLDLDTCGCVICAKDAHAATVISKSYSKLYTAVCVGSPPENHGIIDAPIAREEGSVITRCVSPSGKRSVTEYTVHRRENGRSFLSFRLHTGRTHQIRVHMKHIGCPLMGDSLYGDSDRSEPLMLCCAEVSFTLPDGSSVTCRSGQNFLDSITAS